MFEKLFNKKIKTEQAIDMSRLPAHIGIIMDGNGRWAKKRNLPVNLGHRAGAEALKKICRYADKLGIKALTAYTFSTENWKRSEEEVEGIMNLLREYLSDFKKSLGSENAVVRVIGDITPLSDDIKQKIKETEEFTKNNTGVIVNLALNYGGRDEIVHAVNKVIAQGKKEITEDDISNNIYTSDLPPVDLIIRPSGEKRLSNFLLWESAYAELWYDNVLWPDFKEKHLEKAIIEYQGRNRRFGGR